MPDEDPAPKGLHRMASGLRASFNRRLKSSVSRVSSFSRRKDGPPVTQEVPSLQVTAQEAPQGSWLDRFRQKKYGAGNNANSFGTNFNTNRAPDPKARHGAGRDEEPPSIRIKQNSTHSDASRSDAVGVMAKNGPKRRGDRNNAHGGAALPMIGNAAAASGNAGSPNDEKVMARRPTFLPSIGKASSPRKAKPQGRSERELLLLRKGPPKILKIGGKTKQRNVSDKELKQLRIHFSNHDRGDGKARHRDVLAAAGGKASSTSLLASKQVKLRLKRQSAAERVADGFVNFMDVLRLEYPEATMDDVVMMDKMAREMSGEKLFSRQYPRKRHDAVTRQWDALSAGKEFVFLAELEDFLETKFQDGDHYQMLKALPTPISDIYESEAGIDKEEFMFWILKLEDEWADC